MFIPGPGWVTSRDGVDLYLRHGLIKSCCSSIKFWNACALWVWLWFYQVLQVMCQVLSQGKYIMTHKIYFSFDQIVHETWCKKKKSLQNSFFFEYSLSPFDGNCLFPRFFNIMVAVVLHLFWIWHLFCNQVVLSWSFLIF